jgi:hypothetical protein
MFPIIPLIFALLFSSPVESVAFALADCKILVTPIEGPMATPRPASAVKWVCD